MLTDHALLQHWKTELMLSKWQLCWIEFLTEFDFDIRYILGISNIATNVLR